MEPIVFKTDNNNCYLYSPAKKELLPIPENVYGEIVSSQQFSSSLWQSFRTNGYLTPYKEEFDGIVDKNTIRSSLKNLSQIVFETTTNCNLRCEYCCYGEGYSTFDSRREKSGHLTFEIGKAILDYMATIFGCEQLSNSPLEPFAVSFYGGEPLMNFSVIKQIVEYAETLNFRNRKLCFTMTTNAMLLAKYADFLHKHKFKLLVSLDGDKPRNKYRKTARGGNSFDLVMSNLKKVKCSYPEWFGTFNFNVVYTNVSDVKHIVSWFRENLGKTPQFSPLHPPTLGSKDFDKIHSMLSKFDVPEEFSNDKDLIVQHPLYKRILEFSHSLFGNVKHKETDIVANDIHRYASGTCIPFSKRIFVSYNGELHPCEKIYRDFPLGEITKEGKVLIDCNHIAKNFMEKVIGVKKVCQECYLQLCCTKCIFSFDKGQCDSFTTKQRFSELLSHTVSYIESHPNIVSILDEKIITK